MTPQGRQRTSPFHGFLVKTKLLLKDTLKFSQRQVDPYANKLIPWSHIPQDLLMNISLIAESDCPGILKSMKLVCRHWNLCVNSHIGYLQPRPSKAAPPPKILRNLHSNFPELTMLDLSLVGNHMSNEFIEELGSCRKLRQLEMHSKNVTSFGFLTKLVDLAYLSLSECCQLPNIALENLNHRLSFLDLSGCHKIGDEGLVWVGLLGNLKELVLADCMGVTDAGVAVLATSHTSCTLLRLDLTRCDCISDRSLVSLGAMTRLQELSLAECYQVSSDGLRNLTTLRNLGKLDVSGCLGVTDSGLRLLGMPMNLMDLNLSGCDEVGDQGMSAVSNLTQLQGLDVSFCPKITDGGLLLLVKLAKLSRLNLAGCSGVTSGVLPTLSNSLNLASLGVP